MPLIKIIDTFLFNPAIPLLRTHPKDASKNTERHTKVIEWGIVGSGKRSRAACCLWAVRGINSGAATQRNSGCKMGQGRGGLLDTDMTSSGYIWMLKKRKPATCGMLLSVCRGTHTSAHTVYICKKKDNPKINENGWLQGKEGTVWDGGWIYLFMWLWLWNHYMWCKFKFLI